MTTIFARPRAAWQHIVRRCGLTRAGRLRKKIDSHRGVIVLMDIEFGYKSEIWFVPMAAAEFERWWAAQETFGAPDTLSRMIMSYPLGTVVLPGKFIQLETEEEFSLWKELRDSGRWYFSQFFDDEHTWLETPAGKKIYHKGYCGRDRRPT